MSVTCRRKATEGQPHSWKINGKVITIKREQKGLCKHWKQGLCTALATCMAASLLQTRDFASGPGFNAYDAVSVEESVTLHTEFLTSVHSAESALEAVSRQANSMTDEQKRNPADVNQAVLFAETAVAAAVRRTESAPVIHVSKDTLSTLAETARQVRDQAAQALTDSGVSVARTVAATATLETQSDAFTLVIHSDILDTAAEKIKVSKTTAPEFSITLRPDDFRQELRPDENDPAPYKLYISVAVTAGEDGTPSVRVDVPDGQLSAPLTLSLNPGSNEPSTLSVRGASGENAPARYNPASRTLDARLDSSDVYTFGKRNVTFSDLTDKDRKVRMAVEALARVNVVYGYPDHTFHPERAVTRAEFVAFVMRVLGRVNNSLKSPFADVTEEHGCYHEIASAYYYGIIKGYDEEHFCGEKFISKTQIYTILGRILESEMGYWPPENPAEYLAGEFVDTVDEWAQNEIALATREGLVIRQSTGCFDGQQMMGRGDVALIIYGLYQRLA